MKFINPYWSDQTKIELLEKWIIVHSIIYYELDNSMITDKNFDDNSKQLVELIKSSEGAFQASKWHYVFKDFDGSTGFDLFGKLKPEHKNELLELAQHIVLKFCNVVGEKLIAGEAKGKVKGLF